MKKCMKKFDKSKIKNNSIRKTELKPTSLVLVFVHEMCRKTNKPQILKIWHERSRKSFKLKKIPKFPSLESLTMLERSLI